MEIISLESVLALEHGVFLGTATRHNMISRAKQWIEDVRAGRAEFAPGAADAATHLATLPEVVPSNRPPGLGTF